MNKVLYITAVIGLVLALTLDTVATFVVAATIATGLLFVYAIGKG